MILGDVLDVFEMRSLSPTGFEHAVIQPVALTLDDCKNVKYYDSSNDYEEMLIDLEKTGGSNRALFNPVRIILTCITYILRYQICSRNV